MPLWIEWQPRNVDCHFEFFDLLIQLTLYRINWNKQSIYILHVPNILWGEVTQMSFDVRGKKRGTENRTHKFGSYMKRLYCCNVFCECCFQISDWSAFIFGLLWVITQNFGASKFSPVIMNCIVEYHNCV